MTPPTAPVPLAFGAVLGRAPGGVPAYSSDYATVDHTAVPDRHAFRNYVDGVYTGYKWQCVEFARRWLLHQRGYVFEDVPMAYDIFRLDSVLVPATGERLPLRAFANGARRRPQPGCMMVWGEGGPFEQTGHVAIVTAITETHVRIAEQNYQHHAWAEGADFSRELAARVGADGSFWVRSSPHEGVVLGWVEQAEDDSHATAFAPEDPDLFRIHQRRAPRQGQHEKEWLNLANPDEAAFVEMTGGHRLTEAVADQYKYFVVSEAAERELRRATNELHALFLHATDYVLQDDSRLERFNIPQALWPRIHQSWDNRRTHMITGRLDFCLTERGLKVYEYNSDSASCHMECGRVQGAWGRHFGVQGGRDAGEDLWPHLVRAWQRSEVDGPLHVLIDTDMEEAFHGLFMKSAIEAAGLTAKLVRGLEGLRQDGSGAVVDAEGAPLRWIWKSWAWETALDQLRAEVDDEAQRLALSQPRVETVRLLDVLFQPGMTVFEPLWTLIPSNKAILPVLSRLFPDHRYLLETGDVLTPNLRAKGHAIKPIAGRCGLNITVVSPDATVLGETEGRFGHQDVVYQELAPLPRIGGRHVQLCSFTVDGSYAGAVARTDPTPIITWKSDLMPLRTLSDRELLRTRR